MLTYFVAKLDVVFEGELYPKRKVDAVMSQKKRRMQTSEIATLETLRMR